MNLTGFLIDEHQTNEKLTIHIAIRFYNIFRFTKTIYSERLQKQHIQFFSNQLCPWKKELDAHCSKPPVMIWWSAERIWGPAWSTAREIQLNGGTSGNKIKKFYWKSIKSREHDIHQSSKVLSGCVSHKCAYSSHLRSDRAHLKNWQVDLIGPPMWKGPYNYNSCGKTFTIFQSLPWGKV